MALYRFNLRSTLTTQAVLERLRSLARERPGFGQSLKEGFGWRSDGTPPFIGKIEGNEFRLYRDIHYRNSFLPRIKGHVDSAIDGTKIEVSMNLHPFVIGFMILWLGLVGIAAIAALTAGSAVEALIPAGMFVFGVALVLGGFYPEAFKARRILEERIGGA